MAAISQDIVIVGIPTEAGTHWHGQSKAPDAFQKAGLQDRLEDLGYTVQTRSVLERPQVWQPSPLENSGVRDETAVLSTLEKTKKALLEELNQRSGSNQFLSTFPFIVGGPCAFTPAVLSALSEYSRKQHQRNDLKLGVLWVDNDADLTLPSETNALGSTAILDSMTLTHLTQRDGGLDSMRSYAAHDGQPLVTADNIVLFGLDLSQPKLDHFAYLLDNHFRVFSNRIVKEDPATSMKSALQYLDSRCDEIFLHFDVDVVDSALWPLGNYPSYGGLQFETIMDVLQLALQHHKVCGMIVTEVNLNNDPDGKMLEQLIQGLIDGFAKRLKVNGPLSKSSDT